jgi:glutamyl/glutaminyl-tRNA synthetase
VIRSRIAPTPSGFIHEGNLWSFILTRLLSDELSMRWDDLDRPRVKPEFEADTLAQLRTAGLEINGTTLRQSERMEHYLAALDTLKKRSAIFACRCSRKDLEGQTEYPGTCRDLDLDFDSENVAWRLNTGEAILGELRDFVVRRKDGIPAYQLASVVDDNFQAFNLVVRGEDLRPSTEAQLFLAKVLNLVDFTNARLIHHPLITLPGGEKLSKSQGAPAVSPRLASNWLKWFSKGFEGSYPESYLEPHEIERVREAIERRSRE